MPIAFYRIAGFSALILAAVFTAAYVLIWGFVVSFGISLDSALNIYLALFPMLLLPIVVISFYSRTAGFATMMCHVVISWVVSFFSPIPPLYKNPVDSHISFIPFVILICVVVAFLCSKKEGPKINAPDLS
jgi:hypothetical protein